MMRIGQERLRGVAAMAGLANDFTDTPHGLPPTSRFKPQPLQVPPGKPDRQLCGHR